MAKQAPRKTATQTKKGRSERTAARHPAVYYRLHTLLHTLRSIGTFEDQLCTLLEEVKVSGAAAPEVAAELDQVLAELPSMEYVREIEALREALLPQDRSSAGGRQEKVAAKKPSRAGAKRR